jgi:serine/threonine-protein kinase
MPEISSPPPPPGGPALDRLALITRLRADQLQRWQAGERVPAEDIIREVPALRDDPELAIDLIFSEFLLRRDFLHEAPDLDEYLQRFPQHATVLRHQLELDALAQEAAATQGRADAVPRTGAAPKGASVWTVVGGEASASAPAGAAALPGYEVLGELGRGGMGLVLRGRDLHLGRDLAVKLLPEEYRGQPHLVRRFVNEARIWGRLQHPGIVPVHTLGALPDGRPYFTMKLVEGRTLADLLDDRADPAQDWPRLLGIFEQVCQTVAYAHSKGVIHRDLKPQNVMVGTFGEVQVMDWGLAKVLGPGADGSSAEEVQAGGPSVADRWLGTQLGHALGTLPYMPPEQARGEVERMDQRCDVFSLGAILCEILTGQPPIRGKDAAELLARARACDHAAALAALDGSGADAELVRLAKACLAAEPSDRPRDAGAVAEAVTAYRAGVQERLRQAEVERAAAQARVEEARATAVAERRARRRMAGLVAAVALSALLVVAGLLTWGWLRSEQVRTVNEDLARAEKALGAWNRPGAEAAMRAAEGGVANGGPDELRRRVHRMRDELTLADGLDGIRLEAAALADGTFDPASADPAYAAFFQEHQLAVVDTEDTEVVGERIKGSVVREQVVAALDDWAAATGDPRRRAWLLAVARRAQPGDWSDAFRAPDVWTKPAALEQLAREADVATLTPQLLAALGEALRRNNVNPIPLLTRAQERHRADFWLNFHLGNALWLAGRPEDATSYYRAAQALRPDTSAVSNALALALKTQRRLDEAIAEYDRALALAPRYALAHNNRAAALVNRGRLDEAIAECHTALAIDPKLALAHGNLGNALRNQGRTDEALAEFDRALALDDRLAPAHLGRGNALHQLNRLDEASAAYRKALALAPQYALAHTNLGAALMDLGRLDEAIAAYREAIARDARFTLAYSNLANALADKHLLDEAIAEHRRAIALRPQFGRLYYNLAAVLQRAGRFVEADQAARRGLELMPDRDPWRPRAIGQVQQCQELLALDGKLPALLRGEVQPGSAHERLGLAWLCHESKRRYLLSARLYAEAIADQPQMANDPRAQVRYNAACSAALAAAGQGEDAKRLPDKVAQALRRQALGWLRADLAAWTRPVAGGKPADRAAVRKVMRHWQWDADLAGLRDKEGLGQLPESERQQWQKLWDDVAALLVRAGAAP